MLSNFVPPDEGMRGLLRRHPHRRLKARDEGGPPGKPTPYHIKA